MTLWLPTRRELITTSTAALAAAAVGTTFAKPAETSFSFSVVGDWGRDGGDYQHEVAHAMSLITMRDGSRFVVSTGDNFYGKGVTSIRDSQWGTSFERIYDEGLGKWYATLGNHDYGGIVEAQINKTWHSDRWEMPFYFHEKRFEPAGLPAVHLFFIDTVAWIGSESHFWSLLGSKPNRQRQEDQINWLIGHLRVSTAPIKLVFGHHGIYSIGRHGGEMRMKELDDVLRRFDVTAYINGHDHCMYHVSHQGMHYLCSGAGSRMLANYTGGVADGPIGKQAGCVLKGFCQGTHDAGPVFPAWHAFLGKVPGTSYDLRGGFAHFTLTAQQFGVRFFEGAKGPPGAPTTRQAHSATLRTFAGAA